jgi:hypothetical protein
MADGDDILQLGFEDGVEVLGRADGDDGVGVCEGGEDADSAHGESVTVLKGFIGLQGEAREQWTEDGGCCSLVGVLKLRANRHCGRRD